MSDPKTALAALGWRTDTSARLAQALRDFQSAWNLGTALEVDGSAGPATRAALAASLARKAKGLPDISANFSAREFACNCGGRWSDCRRIWTPRSTIQLAEKYRDLVGPFTPERAGRCARENARVGGAPKSQHLSGRGLDLPIFTVSVAQVRAALGTVGIGTYTGNGRLYVRHVDNRGTWAQWDYGNLRSVPLAPRPASSAPAAKPSPAPAAKPSPAPAPAPRPSAPKRLLEDGDFGVATRRALQQYLKTAYRSGITVDGAWGPASRAYLEYALNHEAKKRGWAQPRVTKTTEPGANTLHTSRLRWIVGRSPVSGPWDTATTVALQRFLNKRV